MSVEEARKAASENLGLLYTFLHSKKIYPRGKTEETFNQISLSYVLSVHKYHESHHEEIALSTWIYNALRWCLLSIYMKDKGLIYTMYYGDNDSLLIKKNLAKHIEFFHGREGKCNDETLLYHDGCH